MPRPTISCISRCFRTGPTPPPNSPPPTRRCSTSPFSAWRVSTAVTARPPAANVSCCCIASACGATANNAGWAGNANAASCRSSTACCAAPPTPPTSPAQAARRGCPTACVTCSRWMRIRACRAKRRAASSARWRTRSTGPRFDARLGRVVDGYAILQPRVAFSLPTELGGHAVPARILGRGRRRPVRRGGFRRLPGFVR